MIEEIEKEKEVTPNPMLTMWERREQLKEALNVLFGKALVAGVQEDRRERARQEILMKK